MLVILETGLGGGGEAIPEGLVQFIVIILIIITAIEWFLSGNT